MITSAIDQQFPAAVPLTVAQRLSGQLVRMYNPDTDRATVEAWCAGRGILVPSLPQIGCIVPGTACGFLFRTDAPGVAFLDLFLSRPGVHFGIAYNALTAIATCLLKQTRGSVGVPALIAGASARREISGRLCARIGLRNHGSYQLVSASVGV